MRLLPANRSFADASEYPSDHTFFCSSHQELPSEILAITESVYEEGSATIQALLVRLLERIARAVVEGTDAVHNATSDDEQQDADSEDEDEDYEMDEYDLEQFDVQPSAQILDRFALQR